MQIVTITRDEVRPASLDQQLSRRHRTTTKFPDKTARIDLKQQILITQALDPLWLTC